MKWTRGALSNDLFLVQSHRGPLFSITRKSKDPNSAKILSNLNDTALVNLRSEIVTTTLPNQYAYKGKGKSNLLFEILPPSAFWGDTVQINAKDISTNKSARFLIKDTATQKATVWLRNKRPPGQAIARIQSLWNWKTLFSQAREYKLTIARNVDMAFIVALALALDEIKVIQRRFKKLAEEENDFLANWN